MICPSDMKYNGDASYTNPESNADVQCSDANAYCSVNDCGEASALHAFFATTDCCITASESGKTPCMSFTVKYGINFDTQLCNDSK